MTGPPLRALAEWAPVAVFAAGAAVNLASWLGLLALQKPWDYSDAVIVPQSLSGRLYPPFGSLPFSINYYPPGVYLLDRALAWWPPSDPYLLPRLAGVASIALTGLGASKLAKGLGSDLPGLLLAGLGSAGAIVLTRWSSLTNPTLEVAALSVWALWAAQRGEHVYAGLLAGAGLWFKQDMVVVLVALGAWYAWRRAGRA